MFFSSISQNNDLEEIKLKVKSINRSCLSKLIGSNEIGRAFTVLAVLESLLPLLTKPFNAFLYKKTLSTFPGAFIAMAGCGYLVVLLIQVYTHFGLKKREEILHEENK